MFALKHNKQTNENEKAIILSLRNAEPCWFGEGAHLTQSKVRWMWLTAEEFWSLKREGKRIDERKSNH